MLNNVGPLYDVLEEKEQKVQERHKKERERRKEQSKKRVPYEAFVTLNDCGQPISTDNAAGLRMDKMIRDVYLLKRTIELDIY